MKSYVIENARIFDGSGSPYFPGSVRVEGERIAMVAAGDQPLPREGAEVINAGGRVLMSPQTAGIEHDRVHTPLVAWLSRNLVRTVTGALRNSDSH
jgi:hypothetical protein